MWAGHVSASLRVISGLSSYVFGALALDLPFCGGTLKLGKYYIQYSFRVWCYFNALSVAFIDIWRIVYHSSERCVISPALDVIHAQLQRLQESRKIRTLSTAVRAIQTHSHELWSKIVNLDLNSVSETDITLAVSKQETSKQTNKNHIIRTKYKQLQFNC